MRTRLLSSGMGLLALVSLTCADTPNVEKKYFDIGWHPVATKENAAYYKTFEPIANQQYQITVFNILDQKLEGQTRAYGFQGPLLISRKWWLTGKLKYEAHHYQGSYYEFDGVVDAYYANGAVRRHDVYKQGKLQTGACYSQQGQIESYQPFSASPTLPDNEQVWKRLTHLQRPNARVQVHKPVDVGFTVTADGYVRSILVVKDSHSATDSAAF